MEAAQAMGHPLKDEAVPEEGRTYCIARELDPHRLRNPCLSRVGRDVKGFRVLREVDQPEGL